MARDHAATMPRTDSDPAADQPPTNARQTRARTRLDALQAIIAHRCATNAIRRAYRPLAACNQAIRAPCRLTIELSRIDHPQESNSAQPVITCHYDA